MFNIHRILISYIFCLLVTNEIRILQYFLQSHKVIGVAKITIWMQNYNYKQIYSHTVIHISTVINWKKRLNGLY